MQASYVQPRAKTLRLAKQRGKGGRVPLYHGRQGHADEPVGLRMVTRNVGLERE